MSFKKFNFFIGKVLVLKDKRWDCITPHPH